MRAWPVTAAVALMALICAPVALADVGDSSNWAGYAVHGARFHRVTAAWRQPTVHCSPGHPTFSAYWIGLGGYDGSALEQIGTEADCGQQGHPEMSVWYEMVPAASVSVPMAIASGDRMAAAVTVTGHRATLVLRDRTRHHLFRITVGSPQIDVSSAEWIVEAPSDCLSACSTLPLADFGSAAFTGARAQGVRGHWGTISDPAWQATAIRLIPIQAGAGGAHVAGGAPGAAIPTSLSPGGGSFAVSFAHVNPASVFGLRRGSGRRRLRVLRPAPDVAVHPALRHPGRHAS